MQEVNAAESRFRKDSDSETVQAAVDSLGKTGGRVVIPRRNPRTGKPEWRFHRPVVLRDHVTLIVDNARLVQETGSLTHLITAEPGTEGIALIGEGNACLSGGSASRLTSMSSGKYGLPDIDNAAMCAFRDVTDLTVRNLETEDPHWFVFVLDGVRKARFENIRFSSCPVVPDEGGILMRGGCREISIEGLSGRTGAHTVEIAAENGLEIEEIRIRNVMTDPARGALLSIRAEGGGKVRKVTADVLMDSSDFFEKARSGACLSFGRSGGPGPSAEAGAISGITATHLYSRAVHAVDILQPFSDTSVTGLMTFGDNIAAIGSWGTAAFALENAVFDHVYYGAGSEPNNASSFISRAAKGARPVMTGAATGFTVKHLLGGEDES